MQMQMAELRVQVNSSSQTTQTAQDLGAVSNDYTQSLALQVNGCSAAQVSLCALSFLLPAAFLICIPETFVDWLAGSRYG